MSIDLMRRRMLAAAFAIAGLAADGAMANVPYVSNRLVSVDVYDRVDSSARSA